MLQLHGGAAAGAREQKERETREDEDRYSFRHAVFYGLGALLPKFWLKCGDAAHMAATMAVEMPISPSLLMGIQCPGSGTCRGIRTYPQ